MRGAVAANNDAAGASGRDVGGSGTDAKGRGTGVLAAAVPVDDFVRARCIPELS